MLTVRLRRQGAKRSPFYRIVVAEDASRRDGRFVEVIGHYNPRTTPERVKLDFDRLAYWQGKGAQLSDTVRTLAVRHRPTAQAEQAEEGGGPRQVQAPPVAETSSESAPADAAPEGEPATGSTDTPEVGPGTEQATS